MRIAIVGSRAFKPLWLVECFVEQLPAGTIVVSGGARGVDEAATKAALACGFGIQTIPAAWGSYGKAAGMIRNAIMVREVQAVVAFWDGVSRGSRHTIGLAATKGIPTQIHFMDLHIESSPNWQDLGASSNGRNGASEASNGGSIPSAPDALKP